MLGLIAGLDGLGTSFAFAALIFSGPVAGGFGMGLNVFLLSCSLLAAYCAWRSDYPATVAQVQETSIAILATASATAVASMPSADPQQKIATVFMILAVSSVGSGVLFYLCGRFRFGDLVRFLPFSVVAGFLAGSGWLLIDGALQMIFGERSAIAAVESVSDPAVMGILVPSLVLAVALTCCLRFSTSPFAVPATMLLSIVLFYLGLRIAGISTETARAWHWLPHLAAVASGNSLPSPAQIVFGSDWHAVLGVLPTLIAVPFISIAGLLLNISGLEVAAGRDIDANTELRVAGQANILVGVAGGASGFTGLGMTLLAKKLGVKGRSAGWVTAAFIAVAVPFSAELAQDIPLFVAVGLMMMLGVELLYDWAILSRKTLPRLEWAVVVAILVSMMLFDFMTGMALGLLFSVVTFVYNYARLPVVRLAASGRDRRSSIDRSPTATHALHEQGDLIHIVELQGYLFFGTVEQVIKAIQHRFTCGPAPRILVLDFSKVSGMDFAAISAFSKIFNMSIASAADVVLSPASTDAHRVLARYRQTVTDGAGVVSIADDLDHALETAESRLLAEYDAAEERADIVFQLARVLGSHPRLPHLVTAMDRLEMARGETLIHAGDHASDIFVLASGRVDVSVTLRSGRRLRLRSMTAGAVLGEVAFYLGGERTADVVIEQDAELYRLTGSKLQSLEVDDPELAILAHRLFATTLAGRLGLANRLIELTNA
ncbi:SLC26A/SulP transporter family protein [Segnochrobactrum spirostomi]|uniref:Cyclic nucleotide-binding domain-containing protein n=1 Tax=Segnochrobactrum spirostomi TaxID=2608987 RepID=A0A6A7Y123_9HYPH|nr:SulP family inorganic anion transporter [Segnochrobactrum spirostomi]MQT12336.1 cyclic nucleotide-binding domain-containing protein [Segnochrobactrum spirostomi]